MGDNFGLRVRPRNAPVFRRWARPPSRAMALEEDLVLAPTVQGSGQIIGQVASGQSSADALPSASARGDGLRAQPKGLRRCSDLRR
jgi:hypothetical protein